MARPGDDRKTRAEWLRNQSITAPNKEAHELYGRGLSLLSSPNDSDLRLAQACLRGAAGSVPLAKHLLKITYE